MRHALRSAAIPSLLGNPPVFFRQTLRAGSTLFVTVSRVVPFFSVIKTSSDPVSVRILRCSGAGGRA